ncbi:MAG: glycosyltransferase family 1 protein [Phototrophicales bacterium]|nr:MAG: glycosyltransferase family 1 protein [Phototrophicales bacterium]
MSQRQYNILSVAATPFFVDRGGHTHIYEQARALQALGHRFTLVTYHIGRDMPDIDTRRIINIPWYKKLDAGPSYHKPYIALLLFEKAMRVANEIKPNIVHAHGWDSAWVAWWLWKLRGVPYVFDMQGSFSGEIAEHGYAGKGGLYFNLLSAIERLTLKASPVVLTSSTEICRQARERFHLSADHIWPILDGVDTDVFSPEAFPPDPELRRALGLPEDKQIIVFMGILKPYQGVDDMIEAARILVYERNYTDAHFLIIGFPDEDVYAQKAAEQGVADYMTFVGKIPYQETGRYVSLGDLAIAPKISMTEGDGKIYFYMAMGLPVVAYERPASLEILGDLGIYAKFHDPQDLARALHETLLQPEFMKQRGQENRQKAIEEYSWLRVASRIVDAYSIAEQRMVSRKRINRGQS